MGQGQFVKLDNWEGVGKIAEELEGFYYKLYIPSGYKKGMEVPLMVMIHGCKQNPNDFAAGTQMNELAEIENFIVLYPFHPVQFPINPGGCWTWCTEVNQHRQESLGLGEGDIIVDMINQVKNDYSIDSNRVYAAGLSSGAAMTSILGASYPEVFCAIGICSGLEYGAATIDLGAVFDPWEELQEPTNAMAKGGPDPYECGNKAFIEMEGNKRKMPVIIFHGTSDTIVHPINAEQLTIQWLQTNFLVEGGDGGKANVNPASVTSGIINGKSYLQTVYNDLNNHPLMELWLVNGMGHAWSGGSSKGSYTDPEGPNASSIIWDFFTRHSA
jgi:poly(hydroxyalkanoate) depolymerase family esterase